MIFNLSGNGYSNYQSISHIPSGDANVAFSPDGTSCYIANGTVVYRYYLSGGNWQHYGTRTFNSSIYQLQATSDGVYGFYGTVDVNGYVPGNYWKYTDGQYFTILISMYDTMYAGETLKYLAWNRVDYCILAGYLVMDGSSRVYLRKGSSQTWDALQQGNSNWLKVALIKVLEGGTYKFNKYAIGYKVLA
ncbi:hypothetical protein [Parageobacillus toebii]|nr:hypothetical protein [Parageobacillus toebii]